MSIFDNVALVLSSDPSTVVEAYRAAMLHEFVIDLPEGYDTLLGSGDDKEGGSGGVQLSGGQKQRLMLARARLSKSTYSNPWYLFLVFMHIF